MKQRSRREKETTISLIPETDAPLKAAAMIFPFLSTIIILIIIDCVGNGLVFPALGIGIGISAVIAILERVSSSWMQASRENSAMEIRRQILSLAAIFGVSLLITRSRLTPLTPLNPGLVLFSLYAVQWLITSSMGKLGKTLPILRQYAARGRSTDQGQSKDRDQRTILGEGAALVGHMREISDESGEFFRDCRRSTVFSGLLLLVQFSAVAAVQFSGYRTPLTLLVLLGLSMIIFFLLRMLVLLLADRQYLLQEGIRLGSRNDSLRPLIGSGIIAAGCFLALLIAPGAAAVPPDTLWAWLARLLSSIRWSQPAVLPPEVLSLPEFTPSPAAELLSDLSAGNPIIRLDRIFRYLGIGAAAALLLVILKPFLTASFYRSIRNYALLTRLSALFRRIQKLLSRIVSGFLQPENAYGAPLQNGKPEAPFQDQLSALLRQQNSSARKRRQLSAVIRNFVRLIEAARSAGIAYNPSDAPGDFLSRIAAAIAANPDPAARQVVTDADLHRGKDMLNTLLYSNQQLSSAEIKKLLTYLQTLSRIVTGSSAAHEKSPREQDPE
jgi:hypothetical protein